MLFRSQNSKTRQQKSAKSGTQMVLFKQPKDQTIVRRTFRYGYVLSTNGSAIMAVVTISSLTLGTIGTQFNNFSQEFQEYRVPRIKAHLICANSVSYSQPGTNTYPHCPILSTRWWELAPTLFEGVAQGSQCKILNSGKDYTMESNYNGFPNAQLWSATNVTLPADRAYGFVFCTPPGSYAVPEASSPVFSLVMEWDVEFKFAQ